VLYPGCDVWLNNPLRPLEACGTSGMKAALNGALNLSILDGWWDEMYDGENGWAIPTADGVEDPVRRDAFEAEALYDLLENSVAPRFYGGAPPARWIAMVRHTLADLGPQVLSTRMLREYVENLYTPAARAARATAADDFGPAKDLAEWTARVRRAWHDVRVLHVDSGADGDVPVLGAELPVRAVVALGPLAPIDVEVQVAYGRVDDDDVVTQVSTRALTHTGEVEGGHRYETTVALDEAGPFGYTVRVFPKNALLASVTELGLVATA
jgi:starch phosphorylase